jgi:hypothetical protein
MKPPIAVVAGRTGFIGSQKFDLSLNEGCEVCLLEIFPGAHKALDRIQP